MTRAAGVNDRSGVTQCNRRGIGTSPSHLGEWPPCHPSLMRPDPPSAFRQVGRTRAPSHVRFPPLSVVVARWQKAHVGVIHVDPRLCPSRWPAWLPAGAADPPDTELRARGAQPGRGPGPRRRLRGWRVVRGVQVGALSVVVEDADDLHGTVMSVDGVRNHGRELGRVTSVHQHRSLTKLDADGAGQDCEPLAARVDAQLLCARRPSGRDSDLRHGHAVERAFGGQ